MNRYTRTAELVPDETSTDITRNMNINLKVRGALPLVSASQAADGVAPDVSDPETVDYVRAIASSYLGVAVATEFKNALYDKDFPNRFTHMAIVSTYGTLFNAYLVHDAKYKDIILVPNLRTLGDTATSVNFLEGVTLSMDIWTVGGKGPKELVNARMSKETTAISIPVPLKQPKVKNFLIPTYHSQGGTNQNNYGITVDKGVLENDAVPTTDFASVGDSATLFGGPIPIYRWVDVGLKDVRYIYVGMRDVDDILIPLPF